MTSDTKHDKTTDLLMKIPPEALAQSEAEKLSESEAEKMAIGQWEKLQEVLEQTARPLRIAQEMQEKYGRIADTMMIYSRTLNAFAPTTEQLSDMYLYNLGKYIAKYELSEQGELDDLEHPSDEALTFIKGYAETFSKCMKEELKDEKYKDKSFLDLFNDGADKNCYANRPVFKENSLILEAIEGTRKRCNAPSVGGKKPKSFDMALDKASAVFWGRDPDKISAGEFKTLDVSGNKGYAYFELGFDFEGLDASTKITAFDETVHNAICDLWNIGNNVVSPSQVYYAMGYNSRPSAESLKRIDESLTKMALTMITIDRSGEYPRHKKDENTKKISRDNLIHIQRPLDGDGVYINGLYVKNPIFILCEPYLMTIAREKAQVTTFSRNLIPNDISKTEFNLKIQNYIFSRLARMKKDTAAKQKILYSTLFKVLEIPKYKPQERAKTTIYKILDHLKKEGYISKYEESNGGVNITFLDKKSHQKTSDKSSKN